MNGIQNTFQRVEIKYLITSEQRRALMQEILRHMHPDEYGKSTICNVYFDTPDMLLIRRSIEKPVYKEKLRVRSYGVAVSWGLPGSLSGNRSGIENRIPPSGNTA